MRKKRDTEGELHSLHVDRLNTIEKLEKDGWEGPDACLQISLYEYGIAWKRVPEENELLITYGIRQKGSDYVRFDRCFVPLDMDPRREWDWADFPALMSFLGMKDEEWDDMPLERRVADLWSYYGSENIFGTSYWEGFPIEGDQQHEDQESIEE